MIVKLSYGVKIVYNISINQVILLIDSQKHANETKNMQHVLHYNKNCP